MSIFVQKLNKVYNNGFKIGLGQSSVKLVDLATIPDRTRNC